MREHILKLRSEGYSFQKIGAIIGKHKSFVARICNGGRTREETYGVEYGSRKCTDCKNKVVGNNKLCNMCGVVPKTVRMRKRGEYIINESGQIARSIRDYLLSECDYKCSKCGRGEISLYTNKVPLQIHHIDGNYRNNLHSNLMVLCPNCHSLTQNYGSLNRGKGRIRK